jgi:UDP:flavonoid glycosyltransferase YjiC (YdhE family)
VLLNSHFSMSFPRPYLPNMIEVGGMHVNHQPTPLPEDLEKFITSAKDGVIYFSMGGNIKPSKMPKEKQDSIIKALSKQKQKVIWKWDDEELAKSVDQNKFFIRNWFPQDDILSHPNVKVFVTHGGLLGSTEAIYHGIPLIGIPIFGDQKLNMARAELLGYGIKVDYSNLTEASFSWALEEVLGSTK